MNDLKTTAQVNERPDLADHYRPLALPAVAAAFAVKRPAVAAVRQPQIEIGNAPLGDFWTPSHDDEF